MSDTVTALVTGASAGIGREFARQLAPRCTHMILVGRRQERLNEVALELKTAHGTQCTILAVDLIEKAGIEKVSAAIDAAGPLDFLVNNAGFTIIGAFDTLPLDQQLTMCQTHITATAALSHSALPAMKAAGQGVIINVSSMVSFSAYKDVAVYGGSKAFVTNFTRALQLELDGSGVFAQALVPGFTHTELHDREAFDHYETPEVPAELWMEASDVVAESLQGLQTAQPMVVAGLVNKRAAIAALEKDLELLNAALDSQLNAHSR